MSRLDASHRPGGGAWAVAVAVAYAAMVLMFLKKKSDEEYFFVLEYQIFGQCGTIPIFVVTLV